MGDAATDNVVFGANVDSHIIPDDDGTYDLGSSSQEWKDIYIDGTAYVDAINFNGTAITATAAELNILDGVTSTAAELNILDGVTSTAAELNILDGVTSTAAELNILDGVTATATELNLLDGVTATTTELNLIDGVTATTAELNILDGVTATATEINLLDGVTSTTAELNILDGVTSTAAELNILDGKAFLDEDDMSSDSATGIASQQSIKAYVDAQQDTVDTFAEVLALSNTTGGTDISVSTDDDITFADSSKAIFGAGSDLQIYHDASDSYIDEVGTGNLLINANNLRLRDTSGNPYFLGNSGAEARVYYAGATKLQTTSTGIDISGTATVDGLTVEGSSAGGTYITSSSGSAAGDVKIEHIINSGRNLNTINSESGSGSAIALALATGETERLNIASNGDISFYEDTGTTAKLTWDASAESLNFADSSKAIFGAGSDLQIYHDGSNSRIQDAGSGNLKLVTDGAAIQLQSATENMVVATPDADVQLYYNGLQKFATTATGIDVTGTATMDGLTVDGDAEVQGLRIDAVADVELEFGYGNTTHSKIIGDIVTASPTAGQLKFQTSTAGTLYERLRIATNGDISFYEDTGTTAKLFWDASAESLGIGVSPIAPLHVKGTTDGNLLVRAGSLAVGSLTGTALSSVNDAVSATTPLTFEGSEFNFVESNSVKVKVDSSGNVGIGTGSPTGNYTKALHIHGSGSGASLHLTDPTSGATASDGLEVFQYATDGYIWEREAGTLRFGTSAQERMRIDSLGKVGIGTSSPSATLELNSDTANAAKLKVGRSNIHDNCLEFGTDGGNSVINAIGNASVNATLVFNRSTTSATSESMRIDGDGNLLVGTTDVDLGFTDGDSGFAASPDGYFQAARDSANAILYLNKLNNDGTIIQMHKDGTAVGSIGTVAGYTYISSDADVGLKFLSSRIRPVNSDGSDRDDAIDLGASSARFDDIYATNGTINTSDRNEKQDIAELSDAEQRVAVAAKGLLRKFRWKSSVAEKGDEARTHFGIIAQDLQAAFAAEGLDAGDYAMFISTTWTDEETNEERTRMGVRYSELLAFIISAI